MIFSSAERNQLLDYNPSAGISGKGGKPAQKKDALTDEQAKVLLDTVKGLPPYVFIMIGLYSGLRREEISATVTGSGTSVRFQQSEKANSSTVVVEEGMTMVSKRRQPWKA